MKKKRVIVAGQLPPPVGGQNLLIAQILDQMRQDNSFETVHWPFFFSRHLNTLRRVRVGKIAELLRALVRLLRIRLAGGIDLLLYPVGGPHFVPIIRDICLLPFARLLSDKLLVQFHAAGIAESMRRPRIFHRILALLMRRADSAIVSTNFNRIDPESLGIRKIDVIPIQIRDEFRIDFLQRDSLRLLYVGHIGPDKGTPALLEAFAVTLCDFPTLRLELVGEPLVPYNAEKLGSDIKRLGIQAQVDILGVLTGEEKWRAFGRASIFAFPTVAPFESFGIVLAEAMMFSLPILATDWRGNRDVLGDSGGAILFPTHPLSGQIEHALRTALARQSKWKEWGAQNRQRFESHFKQSGARSGYTDLVRRMLAAT